MNELPLFREDPLYKKSDRWEITAHDQTFVLYEFSIGFVAHRIFREQFEDWLSTKGLFIANLDGTPENIRRLQDLAWHLWYRSRPTFDSSRPGRRRISKNCTEIPLRYRDLLTDDLRPVFEDSSFWLAERAEWDRDLGHVWKILVSPFHIARTRIDIERLILDDAPSPWRMVPRESPATSDKWVPDRPSRRQG